MSRQQLLLRQELTVSQILRTYGKQYRQITERYSDGGKDDSQAASKSLGTSIALKYAGIDKNSLTDMNDSGMSFDEIADYLDKFGSNKYGD